MKDPREFSLLLPPCEDSEKAPPVYKWRREPSSECNYPGTPDLQKHPLITFLILRGPFSTVIHYKASKSRDIWLGWGEPGENWGRAFMPSQSQVVPWRLRA